MDNKFRLDVVCLAEDSIDISNMANGSTKYLADTKVLYVLYEGDWYEV